MQDPPPNVPAAEQRVSEAITTLQTALANAYRTYRATLTPERDQVTPQNRLMLELLIDRADQMIDALSTPHEFHDGLPAAAAAADLIDLRKRGKA